MSKPSSVRVTVRRIVTKLRYEALPSGQLTGHGQSETGMRTLIAVVGEVVSMIAFPSRSF